MDKQMMMTLNNIIGEGKPAALAIITGVHGSTPARLGSMLLITESDTPLGTVGGGKLEATVIELARQCIQNKRSEAFSLNLDSLNMTCGGKVEVFIRVFADAARLLIVGDGHIALQLCPLGKQMGFHTVIFSDRPEYASRERFPMADEIILGSLDTELAAYPIDQNCYIVIVTRGHQSDELALKTVANSPACYIGMIGSKRKASQALCNLAATGIADDALARIYTPIGLSLGGNSPAEIALSIMAEILLIKNQGRLDHMRNPEIRKQ